MAKEKLSINRFDFSVNLILLTYLLIVYELNHITEMYVAELSYKSVTHASSCILRLNLNFSYLLILVLPKWKQALATAGGVVQTYQQREGMGTHR